MKKTILITVALIALLPVAVKTKEVAVNHQTNYKSVIVDYYVDEHGKPTVYNIENTIDGNKMLELISFIESTTYLNTKSPKEYSVKFLIK